MHHYLLEKALALQAVVFRHGLDRYRYDGGVHWTAVKALVPATIIAIALNFTPGVGDLAHFSLFIGGITAALLYGALAAREPAVGSHTANTPATSGSNAGQ